jgi:transposase
MGRKATKIELHGFTLQELKELRNNANSSYERGILSTIILRCEGEDNNYISSDIQKSIPTIVSYIKNWNRLGLESLKDNRGGSESTFTAEMRDDLMNVLKTSKPNDHDLIGSRWTTSLLAEYINQNYGVLYSIETIRRILISENYTFKRSQPKPTKAIETEKEEFKKNDKSTRYCRGFF